MAISQREARRLRKRVDELEGREVLRRRTRVRDYPGGVNFHTLTLTSESLASVRTARMECGGTLRYTVAAYNGHMHAGCSTTGCARWME